MIHGGPTSATGSSLRLSIQYWTSRGFAVADVNYGGSTGYGRKYRNRLRENWGVVDVADATSAALYLADQGKVDRKKLLIRGGSAGGYTTLASLAFGNTFRAGASLYGVSDLSLLAEDTHKFESRYLDRLVGPYPSGEGALPGPLAAGPPGGLHRAGDPAARPGGQDRAAEPGGENPRVAQVTRHPGGLRPLRGEQHGFRRAENIIRAQEAELYFYSKILDFPLAEPIEPVEILNLSPLRSGLAATEGRRSTWFLHHCE